MSFQSYPISTQSLGQIASFVPETFPIYKPPATGRRACSPPYLQNFLRKHSTIGHPILAKYGQISAPSYPVFSQPPGQIVSFTPKIFPMEVSSSKPSSTVRSTFMPMAFLQNFYQIRRMSLPSYPVCGQSPERTTSFTPKVFPRVVSC